ncbi:MAG TPA: 4-hydroxythreonine-4-phosphate dehydrogenase PdxA [Spirochaetota bacterium]|jgi:4-hydroxythreonine-4-phosphate dehydrogenase|nr:MAG: 4-hydroxythreonine-4-phosphate dehydrogenase [Spirochaetes bacterium ADurb.Bin133]HNZ26278.1 4-hydroxythreonine-4-phosphate dehydrogenase PdxA [Spirochaetota bacterium]HPY88807.1 4-hydroxythreonine-4-phosphate dehydrogenase PdxA [Spirochaetota bacterium]HQB60807.1 4-hydroxythreonine-4-phosphate dehydrogenase PdxA [Spirochaetota bacterium]
MIDLPIISLGSPYGIGYEIFLRSLSTDIYKNAKPFCVGSVSALKSFCKLLDINCKFNEYQLNNLNISAIDDGKDFSIINIDDRSFDMPINAIDDKMDGKIALDTIKLTADLVKEGYFNSVVTLPVSKKNINIYDKNFTGHTEFYQKKWNEKQVFMTFVSNKINLLLLTTHIPLKDVSRSITKDLFIGAINVSLDLIKKLGINKNICVVGINPHAGENGLLGSEENLMKEVLNEINNPLLVGPIPADTAFLESMRSKFGLYITPYHDQGLIPFKMLSFDDGVNLSFGMKYIRTSVDHGTGVDLIGKKTASINSFLSAYNLARKLASRH